MGALSWDELLYGIALLVGVVLVAASVLGGAELGADGEAAELADPDAELEPDTGLGGSDGLLALLGVGRVPTVVLALLLSLLFGGSGLALGPMFRVLLGSVAGPLMGFATASAVALFGTAALGRVFVRVLPLSESYASTKHDLVGLTGRVVVSGRDGAAILSVVDAGGAELRVRARIDAGDAQVATGSAVVVHGYDRERDLYVASLAS